jgi:hypothetical protein
MQGIEICGNFRFINPEIYDGFEKQDMPGKLFSESNSILP